MTRKVIYIFISFILSTTCYSQLGPNDETFYYDEVEFSTSDFDLNYYSNSEKSMGAITTYKGSVYFIYINKLLRPVVVKIDTDGNVFQEYLDKQEDNIYTIQLNKNGKSDGHHGFTIGIDKEGYIHVVGDLHNYGASGRSINKNKSKYVDRYFNKKNLYWVSKEPENINSFIFEGGDEYSYEKVEVMPGRGFSYPSFHKDMNGELFIQHRAKVSSPGHYTGETGWVVAKYDVKLKRWLELGGLPPFNEMNDKYTPLYKAIFWENNGLPWGIPEDQKINKQWYQGFKGDMRFDFNNKWHVVTSINNDKKYNNSMSHVVYAYSDNGGLTFNKANGTSISSLPIRADQGTCQGSVVADLTESPMGFNIWSSVSFNKEGIPIVNYTKFKDNKTNKYLKGTYKYWDKENNTWSKEGLYPTGSHHNQMTVTDANGIITYFGSDPNGLVFRDNKLSLYKNIGYSQPNNYWLKGVIHSIDQRAILEENIMRLLLYSKKENKLKVLSTEGIPNLTPISSEWTMNSFGNSSLKECGMFNDIFQLRSTGIFDDDFSGAYLNQTIEGNFEFEARVINVNYINNASFAGLMVRESNENNSLFFGVAVTSYEGVKTISNGAKNDNVNITEDYEPSEWLKIKRIGNLLESYRSDNGKNWKKLDSRTIKMSDKVTIGLISGSGNTEKIGHSRIDHVFIKPI